MNPGGYMLLGTFCFIGGIAASLTGQDAIVLCFAAGALFGKGYGIWEERDRRRR